MSSIARRKCNKKQRRYGFWKCAGAKRGFLQLKMHQALSFINAILKIFSNITLAMTEFQEEKAKGRCSFRSSWKLVRIQHPKVDQHTLIQYAAIFPMLNKGRLKHFHFCCMIQMVEKVQYGFICRFIQMSRNKRAVNQFPGLQQHVAWSPSDDSIMATRKMISLAKKFVKKQLHEK